MRHQRQLAAIMFTDIEGYTALMQHDEKRATAIRARHRNSFEVTTEAFGGKIHNMNKVLHGVATKVKLT